MAEYHQKQYLSLFFPFRKFMQKIKAIQSLNQEIFLLKE